jgi:hypothetical protein
VHRKIDIRKRDYGADKNWQSNLEIGGGFGWGMTFSSFGASKKTAVKFEQAGWGVEGGVTKGGVG